MNSCHEEGVRDRNRAGIVCADFQNESPRIPHVFELCIMLPIEFAVTFYEDCN
eukprot:gene26420-biopygen16389